MVTKLPPNLTFSRYTDCSSGQCYQLDNVPICKQVPDYKTLFLRQCRWRETPTRAGVTSAAPGLCKADCQIVCKAEACLVIKSLVNA